MYGEKAEEAEELRMDLEDVKSMYKSQVITCRYGSLLLLSVTLSD